MSAQAALDFTAARHQRDVGMARAEQHANGLDFGWSASVYRILCDYAPTVSEFNSYQFRQHLKAIGFPCEIPKGLGGPFQKAVRDGVIFKVGFDQHPERHCSPTLRYSAFDPLASKCHDTARGALSAVT